MTTPDLTKVADAIEKASKPALACPHCSKEILLHHVATIPEKQIITMRLESESGAFSARTVGEVIANFDKLFRAVAKEVGGKVHVFVDSVKRDDKSLEVGFLITAVSEKMKRSQP